MGSKGVSPLGWIGCFLVAASPFACAGYVGAPIVWVGVEDPAEVRDLRIGWRRVEGGGVPPSSFSLKDPFLYRGPVEISWRRGDRRFRFRAVLAAGSDDSLFLRLRAHEPFLDGNAASSVRRLE